MENIDRHARVESAPSVVSVMFSAFPNLLLFFSKCCHSCSVIAYLGEDLHLALRPACNIPLDLSLYFRLEWTGNPVFLFHSRDGDVGQS